MIFFTADLHLGHNTPIKLGGRPFESVEQEADILIRNINDMCCQKDDLYILGDFAYRIPIDRVNYHLSRIKPRIHWVNGNHDRGYQPEPGLVIEKTDYIRLKYDHMIFCLSHYPYEYWDRERYGGYMLHGHIHSRGDSYNKKMHDIGWKRYDVGVDANDYYPVSLYQIVDFFKDLPPGGPNHHDSYGLWSTEDITEDSDEKD